VRSGAFLTDFSPNRRNKSRGLAASIPSGYWTRRARIGNRLKNTTIPSIPLKGAAMPHFDRITQNPLVMGGKPLAQFNSSKISLPASLLASLS
jgi:hypothetical protein